MNIPSPHALVTVEEAAAALRVSRREVELRSEPPKPKGRYLRLPPLNGRALVIALTDMEAELLNEQLGYRAWPITPLATLPDKVRGRLNAAAVEAEPAPEPAPRPRRGAKVKKAAAKAKRVAAAPKTSPAAPKRTRQEVLAPKRTRQEVLEAAGEAKRRYQDQHREANRRYRARLRERKALQPTAAKLNSKSQTRTGSIATVVSAPYMKPCQDP